MLPGSSLILTRIAPVRNYIGKFFRETPLLTYMLWCQSLCPQEGGTFYSHRQKKGLTNPPLLGIITLSFADLAHLVERHLAKVEVASSSLVIRSNKKHKAFRLVLFILQYCETRTAHPILHTIPHPACGRIYRHRHILRLYKGARICYNKKQSATGAEKRKIPPMQYTIPPFGPLWTDGVFTVPTCVADRYLKLASAYQLQALLLLLRHGGSLSTRELAGALGIPERDADSIMDFWVAEGLLQSGNSPAAPAPAEPGTVQIPVMTKVPPTMGAPAGLTVHPPVAEPPKPKKETLSPPRLTPRDIVTLCRENSALSDLLTEAQTVLGRTISTAEQEMLVNMHIYYELPPEVILMLLGYYRGEKEKGRSINLAYINKMANSWSEDGVRTVADADEKLLYLSGTDKLWDKVIAMTGIRHRSPTARQRQMVADWGRDFSEDMLQLACDIMKENADKPSLKYMDSVLRRWKKEGLTTPTQVQEQQQSFTAAKAKKADGRLQGKPSYDLEQIKRDTMNNTDIKF